MQITRIEINNFKSLVNFKLDLAKFTCLVGLNGSGKSTVLQAMDFLSQLMKGDMSGWLERRGWEAGDLKSKNSLGSNVFFDIKIKKEGRQFAWLGSFNRVNLNCTREMFFFSDTPILNVKDGRFHIYELKEYNKKDAKEIFGGDIAFEYQGSILSQLKENLLSDDLIEVRDFFKKIASLDMLSPQYLRQSVRSSNGGLGMGGERMSAFLHELGKEKRDELANFLRQVYPQLQHISTTSTRSGLKKMDIVEKFNNHSLTTEARHINDGMLRLMAILAETLSDHDFLLFDEIENGINQELVSFLLKHLIEARQQVMVTTHSPVILNYLSDEVATASVQFIYKTADGKTQSIPFFKIPSIQKKLQVMGPGEAFIDTDLTRLPEEIETMKQE